MDKKNDLPLDMLMHHLRIKEEPHSWDKRYEPELRANVVNEKQSMKISPKEQFLKRRGKLENRKHADKTNNDECYSYCCPRKGGTLNQDKRDEKHDILIVVSETNMSGGLISLPPVTFALTRCSPPTN